MKINAGHVSWTSRSGLRSENGVDILSMGVVGEKTQNTLKFGLPNVTDSLNFTSNVIEGANVGDTIVFYALSRVGTAAGMLTKPLYSRYNAATAT